MTSPHDTLQTQIGYRFRDGLLIEAALTHRSAGPKNNERLEFLGDGLLNCIIAAEIFRLRPELSEGDLSRLRATLVRGSTLAEIAAEIALQNLLIMGPGELRTGGFQRHSIRADAVEALIGAVYLDGGFDACQRVVLTLYAERLSHLPDIASLKDPKTRLQEWLQARGDELPIYDMISTTGKSHARTFSVRCSVLSHGIDREASGTSRRSAEQSAAADVLSALEGLGG